MAVLQPRLHALQSLDNDEPFAAFFFRKIPFKAFIKQISTFRRKRHQGNNVLYTTDELSIKAECKKAY